MGWMDEVFFFFCSFSFLFLPTLAKSCTITHFSLHLISTMEKLHTMKAELNCPKVMRWIIRLQNLTRHRHTYANTHTHTHTHTHTYMEIFHVYSWTIDLQPDSNCEKIFLAGPSSKVIKADRWGNEHVEELSIAITSESCIGCWLCDWERSCRMYTKNSLPINHNQYPLV